MKLKVLSNVCRWQKRSTYAQTDKLHTIPHERESEGWREREIEAELQTYRRQEQHNTHPLFCNLINSSSALCSPEAKHARIHTHPPFLSHLIWVTSMMFTAGCWLSEWCHAKSELSLLLFRSVFWFVWAWSCYTLPSFSMCVVSGSGKPSTSGLMSHDHTFAVEE